MSLNLSKLEIAVFILLLFIIYVAGLITDVIDVDSAQYAAMSMEMLQSENCLHLTERGKPYLDKPPLIFWLSALSFHLFGICNWTYKLPSFVFALVGVWSTYRLAALLYDKDTAVLAILILSSSTGFVWVNMDVKTDILLMSATIFAIYQLIHYLNQPRFIPLFLGSIGIGLAMLAKGPLGLVMPILTIGGHLLIAKDWQQLFKKEWLYIGVIVMFMLLPMCWGLYTQFDLQPDLLVNNKKGVSGLQFYFWEQSFGRITGENVWKNDTSFLYLFHTTLLLALPWTFHVLLAISRRLYIIFTQFKLVKEFYTISGILLTLCMLSFSSYKIPHYAIIVFPLLAILVANELLSDGQLKYSESLMFFGWV